MGGWIIVDLIFFLLFIISILVLIAGLVKPNLVIKWGDEKKRNRKSVLMVYGIAIIFFFALFVMSIPSVNDEKIADDIKIDDTIITLEKTTGSNEFLKDDIILLQDNSVNMDSYKLSIVGFRVDSSTGDPIKDAFIGDGLVNETFDESVERGFQIGFENSKAEVKNKDEYLSLYFKFTFNDNDITQRDSIIPKFKIKVKDDKDDECVLIYNSQKDKYIDLNSPYGVMLYKTFSDSQEFEISIDDNVFILNKLILE